MIQQKKIALFTAVLFLTACSKQLILKQTNISQINVAAKVQPDQAILDFYAP
jgi:glycine betaine/choline ABC-type transport system substrate-binding protein